MSIAEAEFYDLAMIEPGAPSMLPLDESPWRPLYQEAAGWIAHGHDVVDLGCGTGRFIAELLQRRLSGRRRQGQGSRRKHRYGQVSGVDFSPAALEEAGRYVGEAAVFEHVDLRDWLPDPARAGNTTYVCLEVLEHLADDLDLIRRIPPGHQLVLSVPNYESEAHVRWFRNPRDVWERYDSLLTLRRWSLIYLCDRKAIHVLDTTRRTDSW